MPNWAWIVIGIGAAAALAVVVWSVVATRRRTQLRQRFGPEYERTVSARGGRREAGWASVRQCPLSRVDVKLERRAKGCFLSRAARDSSGPCAAALEARPLVGLGDLLDHLACRLLLCLEDDIGLREHAH